MRQARNILDKELADASNALTREQMVLNECHEIHEVLTRKLEEAQRPDARLRAVKQVFHYLYMHEYRVLMYIYLLENIVKKLQISLLNNETC